MAKKGAFLLLVGPKFGSKFLGLFRAKMTTIGIQNPNVTNDYQQFLARFE